MKKIFAANWKLFKTPEQTREFFVKFKDLSAATTGELVFFPSAICLEAASTSLQGSDIRWGAQNCFAQESGAFTGENSMAVIKGLGAQYVLIGHSERRSIFGETNSLVSEKVVLAQKLDLIPMLCIGETLAERESGKTNEVLKNQLLAGLTKIDKSKKLVVAYEPVWAIGTGKVASPEQVAETHTAVFEILKSLNLETTPILYGGSVKPDNAKELIRQSHVGGFLVGGASLEPSSFAAIASV